jgi:hypothetical protein
MPKYYHLDLHYHHFKWSMEWEVLLNYMPEQLLFQHILREDNKYNNIHPILLHLQYLQSQQLLRGGNEVVHIPL